MLGTWGTRAHTQSRDRHLLSETQFPYSYTGNHIVLPTTRVLSKTTHPEHGQVLTAINRTVGRNSILKLINNKTKTIQ